MPLFVTPIIISTVLLIVLLVFGASIFAKRINKNKHRDKSRLVVYRLTEDKSLPEILGTISCPFTLEIVTHHLGKEIKYYIEASAEQSGALEKLGALETAEYNVCGTKETHIGAYFSFDGDALISDIDIHKFDFSKVNEVGESAVVQFVFKKRKRDKFIANVRVLVASPSPFQSKEIISSLKKSITDLRAVDAKSDEFISRVCSRKFHEEESISLTL